MLDIFLKLIEKLILLSKEKEKNKRALHDDFLSPLMEEFEKVHKQYISSFQKYRSIIKPTIGNEGIDKLLMEIEVDMIHTHTSRRKLDLMSEQLSLYFSQTRGFFKSTKNHDTQKNSEVGGFIGAVVDYVNSISDTESPYTNIGRGHIVEALASLKIHSISGSDEKEWIDRIIVGKIEEMNERYVDIQRAYQQARIYLLPA